MADRRLPYMDCKHHAQKVGLLFDLPHYVRSEEAMENADISDEKLLNMGTEALTAGCCQTVASSNCLLEVAVDEGKIRLVGQNSFYSFYCSLTSLLIFLCNLI